MRVIPVAMAMMRIWSVFVGVRRISVFVFMNMSFRLVRPASVVMLVVTIGMPVSMRVSHSGVDVLMRMLFASEEDGC